MHNNSDLIPVTPGMVKVAISLKGVGGAFKGIGGFIKKLFRSNKGLKTISATEGAQARAERKASDAFKEEMSSSTHPAATDSVVSTKVKQPEPTSDQIPERKSGFGLYPKLLTGAAVGGAGLFGAGYLIHNLTPSSDPNAQRAAGGARPTIINHYKTTQPAGAPNGPKSTIPGVKPPISGVQKPNAIPGIQRSTIPKTLGDNDINKMKQQIGQPNSGAEAGSIA